MPDQAWILPAEIFDTSASVLVFVLSWLTLKRHPQPYFRWWVAASGFLALGGLVAIALMGIWHAPWLGALMAPLLVAQGVALVGSGRRYREPALTGWPIEWIAGAIAVLASEALLAAGVPAPAGCGPALLMLMASHLWFGLAVWPRAGELSGFGARVVSFCSIGWGLLILTYPLVNSRFVALLPETFWLSALLQLGLGLAMVVHLFELAHSRVEALTQQLSQTNQELLRTVAALTDSRVETQTAVAVAREQEALVRQIIHDLRNATQAISLITEDLDDLGEHNPRVEASVAALERQVRFISTFLKEKLAWIVDRSVPGEATMLPEAFEALSSRLAPQLGAKQQRLVLEPPPAVAVHVSPVQFAQLLDNLLANAHQHCPPGTTIRVWSAISDGWATCYVADDGPGIPLEAQSRLGRGLVRPDGRGIGLRNVYELATQVGGLFGFISEPGRGSTFYVTLPLVSWGLTAPGEGLAGAPHDASALGRV